MGPVGLYLTADKYGYRISKYRTGKDMINFEFQISLFFHTCWYFLHTQKPLLCIKPVHQSSPAETTYIKYKVAEYSQLEFSSLRV